MPATDANYIELVRWGITAALGLVGVMLGAWLSKMHETRQRQLAFVERQLRDFYSPLLGIRSEIRMRSELRERVRDAADTEWRRLCKERGTIGEDALQQFTAERKKEFSNVIDYDNQQLKEKLIPSYRQMVNLFRDNMWLAEPATKEFFGPFLEFVEVWERWLAKTLPLEVIQALEHGEESLYPFYAHLQDVHDELREKLKRGYV